MSSIVKLTRQELDELFPAPSLPPSPLSPQRLPGSTQESLAALQDVLKDNRQRYHIFWNDIRFHNHITHRALAIYAVGGPPTIIKDYYARDGEMQRPAFESPGPITEENFIDHLEDENYYQAYVDFFSKQLSEKGAALTLEEFVFSEKYNFQEGRDTNTQPKMLVRLMDGVLHPMIHAGYGVEFGLKGMLAEGLALAAVHLAYPKAGLPRSYFAPSSTDGVDHIASQLSLLVLNAPPTVPPSVVSKTKNVHAFDIVARMLKDNRLKRKPSEDINKQFRDTLIENASTLSSYSEQWTVDLNQPKEIERKMEEVIWLNTLLYGVGGLRPSGFQADFFMMHIVTSSLFLPSLIAYLSSRSQVLLLRAYFTAVLTFWIARGQPPLNVKSFMTTTSVEPPVPTTPPPKTPLTTETTPIPNPFLPLLQSAMTHPNDHLIKIQRAFAHFNTLYGRRPTGYFKDTELEDANMLDGSLFLRVSLLTAEYVGWVREGGVPKLLDTDPRLFSFEGFYDS
ncbi:hypothetical protein L210DRAFT_3504231 [Boletus edulis BED1]|uniref:Oxidoreductase AflY n=1 Tax=Boletus edulis BED1 TaxID=1328754 RepID=A0AAD4GER9_BOLED|nr:hypothetical protein L210DRAFT_3504231 [Boletus edulis BED1]